MQSGHRQHLLHARPGRDRQHRRAVGLRQEHAAQPALRPDAAQRAAPLLWHGGDSHGMPKRVGYMLQKDLLFALADRASTTSPSAWRSTTCRRAGADASGRASCSTCSASTASTNYYPAALSGGMRQRVAFARTLANEPGGAAARRALRGARFPDQARARERHGPAGAQPAPLAAADHPRRRGGGLALRPGDRAHASARPHPGDPRHRHRRRPHRHDGGARVARTSTSMSARSGASSTSGAMHDGGRRRCGFAGDGGRDEPAGRPTHAAAPAIARRCAAPLLVLALPDRSSCIVFLAAWEYATTASALNAFLFGSPSAIFGFLVQMWQDGSLFIDTRITAVETLARLRHRQRARHADRPDARGIRASSRGWCSPSSSPSARSRSSRSRRSASSGSAPASPPRSRWRRCRWSSSR